MYCDKRFLLMTKNYQDTFKSSRHITLLTISLLLIDHTQYLEGDLTIWNHNSCVNINKNYFVLLEYCNKRGVPVHISSDRLFVEPELCRLSVSQPLIDLLPVE